MLIMAILKTESHLLVWLPWPTSDKRQHRLLLRVKEHRQKNEPTRAPAVRWQKIKHKIRKIKKNTEDLMRYFANSEDGRCILYIFIIVLPRNQSGVGLYSVWDTFVLTLEAE